MKEKNKRKADLGWLKIVFLIVIVTSGIFAYGKVAGLIRSGIKAALESSFNAPAEVSAVKWTPMSISIGRIAVVGENAEKYLFVLKKLRAEISFNHLIRKSLTVKDINLDLDMTEKVPEASKQAYREILAKMQAEKEEIERKKEGEKQISEQKQADVKEEIKRLFSEYISKKQAEIDDFRKSSEGIAARSVEIKNESETLIPKMDKAKEDLITLEQNIEKAYKEKDAKKITEKLKEIDAQKKTLDALKKESETIVKKISEVKKEIVSTKEGISAYVKNIKDNYKEIILADIGFLKDQIPSLANIYAGKDLLYQYGKLKSLYEKVMIIKAKLGKDEEDEKEVKKKKKKAGRDLVFPLRSPMPKFWLMKGRAEIRTEELVFRGDLKNITSSNKEINALTEILLHGQKNTYEVDVNTYFNDENFYGDISAKNFTINGMDLSVVILGKASVNYKLEYKIAPEGAIDLKADIFSAEYEGTGPLFQLISNIKEFYLNASGEEKEGKWIINAKSDLDAKVRENLAKELAEKKKEAVSYAEKMFDEWYEKNIPAQYDILGKNSDMISGLADPAERKKALDKLYSDLKTKANGYLDELKKGAINEGIKKLF